MKKRAMFTTNQSLAFGAKISPQRVKKILESGKRISSSIPPPETLKTLPREARNKFIRKAYISQITEEIAQGHIQSKLGPPKSGPYTNYPKEIVEKHLNAA